MGASDETNDYYIKVEAPTGGRKRRWHVIHNVEGEVASATSEREALRLAAEHAERRRTGDDSTSS